MGIHQNQSRPCVECWNGQMRGEVKDFTVSLRSGDLTIENILVYCCDTCGEESLDRISSRTVDKAVANANYNRIRAALGRVVEESEIGPWLCRWNDKFDRRPIDLVGTPREIEIYDMIDRLESGEPI